MKAVQIIIAILVAFVDKQGLHTMPISWISRMGSMVGFQVYK